MSSNIPYKQDETRVVVALWKEDISYLPRGNENYIYFGKVLFILGNKISNVKQFKNYEHYFSIWQSTQNCKLKLKFGFLVTQPVIMFWIDHYCNET
jgi:hypothetical protein